MVRGAAVTPEELVAVVEALPGVQVDTSWLCETGEVDPSKVFVAVQLDMVSIGDEFEFKVRIERSETDGHPDRSDLPTPELG
jgi:hypothetical protein